MEPEKYLHNIQESQTISSNSEEMKILQTTREEVEKLLTKAFADSNPTIRYGGSKIKGTMIKDSYDLDLVCYFAHDDENAGESLKDIYNKVKSALENNYYVEPKRSALRLKSKDGKDRVDFHIDVVPGRYIDDTNTDCYIYQSGTNKERLKTNLDVHIKHIRDTGFTDIIRLTKLWNIRIGLNLKTFILELLVVKYAKKYQKNPLSEGLVSFWKILTDNKDLSVEDPANPEGNDLSELLNDGTKQLLNIHASSALQQVESDNWETILGPIKPMAGEEKIEAIRIIASGQSNPPKPWAVK